MNQKIKEEWKRRNSVLEECGIDTEGFGLLNSFFLYDQVVGYFGWLSSKLLSLGCIKLAFIISGVSIYQFKVKGFEIRQTIVVNGKTGSYKQECYVHDDDPEKAESYVLDKYLELLA